MGVFNYSRFHYFDKDGHELILSHKPGVRINIQNDYIPEFYAEYAFVKSTPDLVDPATNSSLLQVRAGMRFNIEEDSTLNVKTSILDSSTDSTYADNAFLRKGTYELRYYNSTFGKENYPYPLYNDKDLATRQLTLDKNNLAIDTSVNFFPTYTFNAKLDFNKVSTGLVETQTIYVLVDDEYAVNKDGIGNFVPVSEYASHYNEFVVECEKYDSSINQINEKISYIDSSISELESILSDKIDEINSLNDELDRTKNEIRYVTRELNKKFESYGVVDPQLSSRQRELHEKIQSLDSSIDAVYASDPTNFGLLDDYNDLKESLNKDISDLRKEASDLYIKRDYFKDVNDYIDRFEFLFFIDCREQKDFRVFDVRYDEMKWSDRKFLNFKTEREDGCNNTGFSVNVGFSGENDGVYEHKMYICIVDKNNTDNSELGEVYPIGEITMSAETEGEDERYRTFFENFGIPDPKYYNNIFIDSDINNDSPDFISINKHSKKMFLAYNDIFPYIGSYKGLLNAIKTLGYEDEIFFKEWYKEIGNSAMDDSGYTTYEISFKDTSNRNVISNLDISERIHLRKMNWVSMIYKINEELDQAEDKWGFPQVITNYKNFNTDRLVKILSLKNWLEKYAIGVNCHITDVGGEGLVFERYNLQKYGTYQKVYEYTNEKAISAVLKNDAVSLNNGSATIDVDIYTSDKDTMIEEISNLRFLDFCDGFFDKSKIYHDFEYNVIDSKDYIYFGKCFDLHDNINTFEIRTRGKHDSYRFGESFLDEYSPDIIVDDDKIMFDFYQCFNKYKNSAFINPPVIQIENGVIKKYSEKSETNGKLDFYANIYPYIDDNTTYYRIDIKKNIIINDPEKGYKITDTFDLLDVPTFIPPSSYYDNTDIEIYPLSYNSNINKNTKCIRSINKKYGTDSNYYKRNGNTYGLRYCTDNINGIPSFKILGYEEKNILFSNEHIRFPYTKETSSNNDGYEYMLEIINGRMIFNDPENNSVITLNFVYDDNEKHQYIFVNSFKESEMSSMYKYKISNSDTTNRFLPGKTYSYFVNGYKTNASDYVSYDGSKSVTVNHIGEYTVDAILYDEFNNIFAKRSARKLKVLPSFADASIFSESSNSGYPYNETGVSASTNTLSLMVNVLKDVSECVFEYKPKLQISTINRDTCELSYYGKQISFDGSDDFGTNILENQADYKNIIFSSMSDRYDIISEVNTGIFTHSSDSKIFRLIKTSSYASHLGIYDYLSTYYMFYYYGITRTNIGEDLDKLYSKHNSEPNGTFADVTLYIYDELCEYPVISIPGIMLPGKAYNKSYSPEQNAYEDKYDEYFFMPTDSENINSADLSSTLASYCDNEKTQRFGFYVIPQWAIPCTVERISERSNTIDVELDHQIFSSTCINNSGLDAGRMITLFYNTELNDNYFGKGSYMIKSKSTEQNYSLYAYLGNKKKTSNIEQYGFEGNTWFGPSSLDYMTYICDIDEKDSDNQNNTSKIIDNTSYKYGKLFIDKNYSVSLRNFDPNDAIKIWEYNPSDYTSQWNIKTRTVYNIPVTSNSPYFSFIPYIPGHIDQMSTIRTQNITVKWKIYKRVGDVYRKLILESFNKILFIKLTDKGLYDIEMTVWDQYGNRFDKKMDGYITYK